MRTTLRSSRRRLASRLTLASSLVLATAVPAQDLWLPAGAADVEGNANNVIPWWSLSSTYQQVHDLVDMDKATGGNAFLMSAMIFRRDGQTGSRVDARSLEVQITVGQTPVTSQTTSRFFADNLGPSPSTVLPFTLVNLPSLPAAPGPNPPGWILPFSTPFLYSSAQGDNFCWEWRHRNSSTLSRPPMDAFNGSAATLRFEGTGCVATGQTLPAVITLTQLDMTRFTYRNVLFRAAASAPAVFLSGQTRSTFDLIPLCAPLLLTASSATGGTTDAAGTWDLTLPTGDLRGLPSAEYLGQFMFLDKGLPVGRGVSNMSVLTTPLSGAWHVTRLYRAPLNGGSGHETGTVVSQSSVGFGLAVAFR